MVPIHPIYKIIQETMREMSTTPLVFLVGGSVRDMILGSPAKDIDFMVEGDFFAFVKRLAEKMQCRIKQNSRLLTATLDTPWGAIDLAEARQEKYDFPGALPKVEPAGWAEDLRRRDFSINALALPLLREGWGEILDVCGGIQDAHAGLIRVLHRDSFKNDPTRILRALRYKGRLQFALEQETAQLLQEAWPYLRIVSPVRRFKEWKLLCQEKESLAIIEDIQAYGGWEYLCGGLPYKELKSFDNQDGTYTNDKFRQWFYYLLILLEGSLERLASLAEYWGLSKREQKDLQDTLQTSSNMALTTDTAREIYHVVSKLPVEGQRYLFNNMLHVGLKWEEFAKQASDFRMPINGHDLIKAGYIPGSDLRRALEMLDKWYLQGRYDNKKDGLRLLAEQYKEDKSNGFS